MIMSQWLQDFRVGQLEYNAGVPLRPTAPQIEQGDQDSSTSGSSPPVSIALIAASVEVSSLK